MKLSPLTIILIGVSILIMALSYGFFQLYLPSAAAAPVAEAPTGGGGGIAVSAPLAEVLWCCYAWPASRGNSGQRAFFVNQAGEILVSQNLATNYSGFATAPTGVAAVLGTVGAPHMASSIAVNATGVDAEFWQVVN